MMVGGIKIFDEGGNYNNKSLDYSNYSLLGDKKKIFP